MKWVLLITMFIVTSVKAQDIVIDSWWNVDYAKNACHMQVNVGSLRAYTGVSGAFL
jgi:hypothetical protein